MFAEGSFVYRTGNFMRINYITSGKFGNDTVPSCLRTEG